jgi:hypothetical protein
VNVLHRLRTSPVASVDPPSDRYVDMADSSASGGSTADLIKNLSLLGAMSALFAVPLGFILVRRRRQRRPV